MHVCLLDQTGAEKATRLSPEVLLPSMPEVRLARQLPPALLGDMPLSSLGFDIACVCAVAEVRREFGLGCVERPIQRPHVLRALAAEGLD
jgi:hypothetical protein